VADPERVDAQLQAVVGLEMGLEKNIHDVKSTSQWKLPGFDISILQ
jgi:hypothetical protein